MEQGGCFSHKKTHGYCNLFQVIRVQEQPFFSVLLRTVWGILILYREGGEPKEGLSKNVKTLEILRGYNELKVPWTVGQFADTKVGITVFFFLKPTEPLLV